MALIKAGRTKEAKQLLYRLLKDEPGNAQAWYLTSYVASTFDKQLKSVKKALWLEPTFVEAAERRAELLGASDVDAIPSQPLFFREDITATASQDLDFPKDAAELLPTTDSQPFPAIKYIVGMVVGTTLMVLLVILLARAVPISSMAQPDAQPEPTLTVQETPAQ
jgi:hypothetical protein